MKKRSYDVLTFVKENDGADFTAKDIANALEMDPKSVNGIITMNFQRHEPALMLREEHEVEVETEKGTKKMKVKFIRLTPEGRVFEPETIEE